MVKILQRQSFRKADQPRNAGDVHVQGEGTGCGGQFSHSFIVKWPCTKIKGTQSNSTQVYRKSTVSAFKIKNNHNKKTDNQCSKSLCFGGTSFPSHFFLINN